MDFNQKLGKGQIVSGLLVGGLVIYIMMNMNGACNEQPRTVAQYHEPVVRDAPAPQVKQETEKEYKASCIKFVYEENAKGIYYKEYLKSPQKFVGKRLSFPAKIFQIEESGNRTWIQAYITRNYDSVIINFDGTMKIYKDDIIQVWGEGDITTEGQNRMGASISEPTIRARYIKKIRSEE